MPAHRKSHTVTAVAPVAAVTVITFLLAQSNRLDRSDAQRVPGRQRQREQG
jgi:hypothetical protein